MHDNAEGYELFGKKQKQQTKSLDGSAYSGSDREGSDVESDSDIGIVDDDFVMKIDPSRQKGKSKPYDPLDSIHDTPECGLCRNKHGPGECPMVERSENLAEYREMLILHADDEPWEERVSSQPGFLLKDTERIHKERCSPSHWWNPS